jgi:hypothetical protein
MCQYGTFELVRVRIPSDLSCSGRAKWKRKPIDKCIAPIVRALQEGGIMMRGSCCGHGRGEGDIELEDGRHLRIIPASKPSPSEGGIVSMIGKSLWPFCTEPERIKRPSEED